MSFAAGGTQVTIRTSRLRRRRLGGVIHHLAALAAAAVFVVPMLWVAAASLRQPGLPPSRTIEWLPSPISWSNYWRIFQLAPLGSYALNSLSVVALAIPLTLITASWAGFAMAQLPARPRNILVVCAILLRMVPSAALWLPRFLLFKQMMLLDTFWILVVPAFMGTSPFFALLFYWTFRRIPYELFEAARLDGAGLLSVWSRIAMPLAKPTITAVAVLAFTDYWSDFVQPLLYLKSESRYTLPIGLRVLQQLDQTNWPFLMAAAMIMTVPVIVMFVVVQRYFWPENRLGGIAGR
jgi:multiple sugar transport system permease protein